ncbi:nucleotidyltransferase domain-containing protein [Echinicola marina]|nr:nucleotidyltransferase domain-containing protein [Echinicola marina]
MIPKNPSKHSGIKETVRELCEQHHVDKLYLFGSMAEGKVNENSDMDLLVKFKELELKDYFDNYIHLQHQLEVLFQRKVDLMEFQTLKNPILIRSIDKNKKLIYG